MPFQLGWPSNPLASELKQKLFYGKLLISWFIKKGQLSWHKLPAFNLSSPLFRLWWYIMEIEQPFVTVLKMVEQEGRRDLLSQVASPALHTYPRLLLHWVNKLLIWLSYYNQLLLSATKARTNQNIHFPNELISTRGNALYLSHPYCNNDWIGHIMENCSTSFVASQ